MEQQQFPLSEQQQFPLSEQQQYPYAEQQQFEVQQEQSLAQQNFDQEQALMQQNYLKLFEGGAVAQQGNCPNINIPTLAGDLSIRVCPAGSDGCGLVSVVLGRLVNTHVETCKKGSLDLMCTL